MPYSHLTLALRGIDSNRHAESSRAAQRFIARTDARGDRVLE